MQKARLVYGTGQTTVLNTEVPIGVDVVLFEGQAYRCINERDGRLTYMLCASFEVTGDREAVAA